MGLANSPIQAYAPGSKYPSPQRQYIYRGPGIILEDVEESRCIFPLPRLDSYFQNKSLAQLQAADVAVVGWIVGMVDILYLVMLSDPQAILRMTYNKYGLRIEALPDFQFRI
ncbi:hypothetical protein BX600DRAFT_432888 [Xylariales sp. PMI_506]|nr:hypothetical protein BX600DRAFT_432888 [Xylariales sp. PMI_506]